MSGHTEGRLRSEHINELCHEIVGDDGARLATVHSYEIGRGGERKGYPDRKVRAGAECERDELIEALREYILAATDSMRPPDGDDVRAMLRFGRADQAAKDLLAKHTPKVPA